MTIFLLYDRIMDEFSIVDSLEKVMFALENGDYAAIDTSTCEEILGDGTRFKVPINVELDEEMRDEDHDDED